VFGFFSFLLGLGMKILENLNLKVLTLAIDMDQQSDMYMIKKMLTDSTATEAFQSLHYNK
jgi:hypothetical protein